MTEFLPTRPECFDFAMDFLGEPESKDIRSYVEHLERTRDELETWRNNYKCGFFEELLAASQDLIANPHFCGVCDEEVRLEQAVDQLTREPSA